MRYLLIQYYAKVVSKQYAPFIAEKVPVCAALIVIAYFNIVSNIVEDKNLGLDYVSWILHSYLTFFVLPMATT